MRADGSLDRMKIRVLGLPMVVDACTDILTALGVGGWRSRDLAARGEVDYGSDHCTCVQFDDDWRRSSALMDERLAGQWRFSLATPMPWHDVILLFSKDMGPTRDRAFMDNMLYVLMESPRI